MPRIMNHALHGISHDSIEDCIGSCLALRHHSVPGINGRLMNPDPEWSLRPRPSHEYSGDPINSRIQVQHYTSGSLATLHIFIDTPEVPLDLSGHLDFLHFDLRWRLRRTHFWNPCQL